jgi:hypothetical protein
VGRASCVRAHLTARLTPCGEHGAMLMAVFVHKSAGILFGLFSLGLVGCSLGPTAADVEKSARTSEDSLQMSCRAWDERAKSGAPSDASTIAAQCWADLRQEQEIHAQQRTDLRTIAAAAPAPAVPSFQTYMPPHSVYTLQTQPPDAPSPSPIPNIGASLAPEPPVKTWGETSCSYLVPPYLHDQPISTVSSAVPSGCR